MIQLGIFTLVQIYYIFYIVLLSDTYSLKDFEIIYEIYHGKMFMFTRSTRVIILYFNIWLIICLCQLVSKLNYLSDIRSKQILAFILQILWKGCTRFLVTPIITFTTTITSRFQYFIFWSYRMHTIRHYLLDNTFFTTI